MPNTPRSSARTFKWLSVRGCSAGDSQEQAVGQRLPCRHVAGRPAHGVQIEPVPVNGAAPVAGHRHQQQCRQGEQRGQCQVGEHHQACRCAPASEPHRADGGALAADLGVPAAAQQPGLEVPDHRDDQHHDEVEPDRRPYVGWIAEGEQPDDPDGEDVDVRLGGEDGRDREEAEAEPHHQQCGGAEAGPHGGQRHSPQCPQIARAADPGLLLERRVDVAQPGRDEHEGVGHLVDRVGEDQAVPGVYVDRPGPDVNPDGVQQRAQREVQVAGLPRSEQSPSHGTGDRGEQERNDRHDVRQDPHPGIGSLVQPRQYCADQQGRDAADADHHGRVQHQPAEVGFGEGRADRRQVEPAVIGERADHDQRERPDGEQSESGRQHEAADGERAGSGSVSAQTGSAGGARRRGDLGGHRSSLCCIGPAEPGRRC
jgi:hypothetical protein